HSGILNTYIVTQANIATSYPAGNPYDAITDVSHFILRYILRNDSVPCIEDSPWEVRSSRASGAHVFLDLAKDTPLQALNRRGGNKATCLSWRDPKFHKSHQCHEVRFTGRRWSQHDGLFMGKVITQHQFIPAVP